MTRISRVNSNKLCWYRKRIHHKTTRCQLEKILGVENVYQPKAENRKKTSTIDVAIKNAHYVWYNVLLNHYNRQ